MSNDRIVVCTPTYHRPAELESLCIRSVLAQTHRDFEHVIVKDGCRDGGCDKCRATDEVGERYSKLDPRIRYISLTENKGGLGYFARNHAVETSSCGLVAYLDDDDWWDANHLETLLDALKKANASFAVSGSKVYSHDGRLLQTRITKRIHFTSVGTNEILHRRELFDKYGPWKATDKNFNNHDWELVSRWLVGGERFAMTGLATSNFKLKPSNSVAIYFYSQYKHRLLHSIKSLFLGERRAWRVPETS